MTLMVSPPSRRPPGATQRRARETRRRWHPRFFSRRRFVTARARTRSMSVSLSSCTAWGLSIARESRPPRPSSRAPIVSRRVVPSAPLLKSPISSPRTPSPRSRARRPAGSTSPCSSETARISVVPKDALDDVRLRATARTSPLSFRLHRLPPPRRRSTRARDHASDETSSIATRSRDVPASASLCTSIESESQVLIGRNAQPERPVPM